MDDNEMMYTVNQYNQDMQSVFKQAQDHINQFNMNYTDGVNRINFLESELQSTKNNLDTVKLELDHTNSALTAADSRVSILENASDSELSNTKSKLAASELCVTNLVSIIETIRNNIDGATNSMHTIADAVAPATAISTTPPPPLASTPPTTSVQQRHKPHNNIHVYNPHTYTNRHTNAYPTFNQYRPYRSNNNNNHGGRDEHSTHECAYRYE
jgi:hypothetical protein